jgi:hypothetical protein
MLDLETLGTTPDSVILTIGAVLFNREEEDNYNTILNDETRIFTATLNFQEQIDLGRTVSESTLVWWMDQNKLAQRAAFSAQRKPVAECLQEFSNFFKGAEFLWGNGSSFDNVMLESLYRNYSLEFPCAFWNYRDLRTVRDMGDIAQPIGRGIEHDALQDAAYQVLKLQAYWRNLR